MQRRNVSVVTGITLSVLASLAAVYPVAANLVEKPESELLLSQATAAGEISGTITNISGETVELALPSGQTREITVPQSTINQLGLRSGTRIAATVDAQGVATSVRVLPVRALW